MSILLSILGIRTCRRCGKKLPPRQEDIPGIYVEGKSFDLYEDSLCISCKLAIAKETAENIIRTTPTYKRGQEESKREGYVEASYEYEEKLLKQAESFLAEKEDFKEQKQEYKKLIDAYERYIDEMSKRNDLTAEGNAYLQKLIIIERKLKE